MKLRLESVNLRIKQVLYKSLESGPFSYRDFILDRDNQ